MTAGYVMLPKLIPHELLDTAWQAYEAALRQKTIPLAPEPAACGPSTGSEAPVAACLAEAAIGPPRQAAADYRIAQGQPTAAAFGLDSHDAVSARLPRRLDGL